MKDLSLYIHIPFCKTICLYCNFLTFAHKNKKIPKYVESLIKEIESRSREYTNYKIETIYFGGGTPSLIESGHIQNILDSVRKNFQMSDDAEINIECNPESLDGGKLEDYLSAGITRISLGIQTFDKKTLWRIARPHDSATIFRALTSIQLSNFKNFGTDFIIGLPDQTLEKFKEELDTILGYNPPHLSFYFLSYDTKKIDLFASDCPAEEQQIAMYEHLTKTLKKMGYIHYEVSNYAKPGFECQHNLRYWNRREYLGFGIGAHSYIDEAVWENQTDFDAYLENPLLKPEKAPLDEELRKMDYIMLQLRTHKGINRTEYQKKYSDYEALLAKAEQYHATGKLLTDDAGIRASEEGFLILDAITRDLL